MRLNYFTPAYLNFSVPPLETTEVSWQHPVTKETVETQIKYYSLGSITIRYELNIEGKSYKDILDNARDIANDNVIFEEMTKQISERSRKLIESELGIKTYAGFYRRLCHPVDTG